MHKQRKFPWLFRQAELTDYLMQVGLLMWPPILEAPESLQKRVEAQHTHQ